VISALLLGNRVKFIQSQTPVFGNEPLRTIGTVTFVIDIKQVLEYDFFDINTVFLRPGYKFI
jgi:hypothetical protein